MKLYTKRLIYLDHAATTYLDKQVFLAMKPYWMQKYGNPSSIYSIGLQTKSALNDARRNVAEHLHCKPEEIIFTAGGTESVNLAIFGVIKAFKLSNRAKPIHIITTKIEHHAVLHSIEALEKEGITATYLGVDKFGFINLKELQMTIKPETLLISVMYANNEIGTIEPIAQIGKLIKIINENRLKNNLPKIYFHSDACQAGGVCNIAVDYLNTDLLTLNGSKIYGPKQTGVLFVKKGTPLAPIIYGGGQEKSLRSGTENVPGIIGFSTALKIAQKSRSVENLRLKTLRDYFISKLQNLIPNVELNGPDERSQKNKSENIRLPNNINITFPKMDGEAMLLYLDAHGICVSTGSACNSSNFNPSHVLMAIGKSLSGARGTIRITLGKKTTRKDLDFTLSKIVEVYKKMLW